MFHDEEEGTGVGGRKGGGSNLEALFLLLLPFLLELGRAPSSLASRINNEAEKGGEEAHDTEK